MTIKDKYSQQTRLIEMLNIKKWIILWSFECFIGASEVTLRGISSALRALIEQAVL